MWKADARNPYLKWKRQGGGEWWAYGDFREFSDVGGTQVSLKTTDQDVAEEKIAARVTEFRQRRKERAVYGAQVSRRLGEYAQHHLIKKAKAGSVTERHLSETEYRLQTAIEFFKSRKLLIEIDAPAVSRFVAWLRVNRSGKGGRPLKDTTARKYINALSHLYTRAQSEGVVPAGYNPVHAMLDKPSNEAEGEANWFEVDDAATILHAASVYDPGQERSYDITGPVQLHAMVATLLLTGMRRMEMFGLLVKDVNFKRKTVRVWPNAFRDLKTKTSRRVVPLWPQLEEALTRYLDSKEAPTGELLFPSRRTMNLKSAETVMVDMRKSLDCLAEVIGWGSKDIRTKMFRHTYCAARLQTLDQGHPVALYTVAREMGHGGDSLVKRIYGHLGQFRHRSDVVEYPQQLSRLNGSSP